jgi:hypothetical protein
MPADQTQSDTIGRWLEVVVRSGYLSVGRNARPLVKLGEEAGTARCSTLAG